MLHIQEFHRRFKTEDQRLQYLYDLRFSDVRCPKCDRENAYHRHPTKLCYTCNCGQSHIYPKKGTIFEASPVPLSKWFYGVFLMHQSANGVSAKELERKLDVTYPTAWRMAKKIRSIMPEPSRFERPMTLDEIFRNCVGEEVKVAGKKAVPAKVAKK